MAKTLLSCECGKVRLEVSGAPIIVAECYCNSCRDARARMGSLPGAPTVVGANGSTHFVLYRKDRVQILAGREWLRNFRLGPEAHTRRVLASCCNTPVLLEFKGGHWVSLYGNLWHGQPLPKAGLRTMTSDLAAGVPWTTVFPRVVGKPPSFMASCWGPGPPWDSRRRLWRWTRRRSRCPL